MSTLYPTDEILRSDDPTEILEAIPPWIGDDAFRHTDNATRHHYCVIYNIYWKVISNISPRLLTTQQLQRIDLLFRIRERAWNFRDFDNDEGHIGSSYEGM